MSKAPVSKPPCQQPSELENLRTTNRELAFQCRQKEKLYAELLAANERLRIQKEDKDARAAELVIANKELQFQNEERTKRAKELHELVFYDILTGLPNRRTMIDFLHLAFYHSSQSGHDGAVLFVGLDDFRDINDTLGHDFGNLLLKEVALRLVSCLREGDTAGRLGGDEFVVILKEASERTIEVALDAHTVGARILATLSEPYKLGSHECHTTASIGATFFREYGKSAEECLKRADIAMNKAKQEGGNSLRFFDPEMQTQITDRVTLENDLKEALNLGQFVLYYQIQVDAAHRILGVESLIRWQHPKRGLVSPAEFIPAAEDTGLIVPIGLWALETACAQLEAWKENKETSELVVSVNISARQFQEADFVSRVLSIVECHDINPALLKLELTESLVFESIDKSIASIEALKATGIQFSLDDFGTGYSSLRYLQRLPIDELKIDLSFVQNIITDSDDRAIVLAIITMAHSLGLDVIAEGVESVEQQQLLMEKGCLKYQGYLFGRPVPVAELAWG